MASTVAASLPQAVPAVPAVTVGEQAALPMREHSDVGEDPKVCKEFEDLLDREVDRPAAIDWIADRAVTLAFAKHGCRVVQKAIDVAGAPERERIALKLQPHVMELCESLHGNHVLAKLVEVLPPTGSAVGFVVEKLRGCEVKTAKHRFGCRIWERLIEHCADDSQMRVALDAIVTEAAILCRHPYGNFVVQHLLEHGSPERKTALLALLLPELPLLASHRTAAHVVQKALVFTGEAGERAIVLRLLGGEPPHSLEEVACTRYGSFVVEDIFAKSSAWAEGEVRARLTPCLLQLSTSQFGKRVADKIQPPSDDAEWAAAGENASVLGGG